MELIQKVSETLFKIMQIDEHDVNININTDNTNNTEITVYFRKENQYNQFSTHYEFLGHASSEEGFRLIMNVQNMEKIMDMIINQLLMDRQLQFQSLPPSVQENMNQYDSNDNGPDLK